MLEHFNINFFGVINLTNAVLPHMRQRRSGTVAMIGSRSAFRNELIVSVPEFHTNLTRKALMHCLYFKGVGYYAAAKAAIHCRLSSFNMNYPSH